MTSLKNPASKSTRTKFWSIRVDWVLMAFLIISGLLLIVEHRAHLFVGTAGLIISIGVCVIVLAVVWHSHQPTTSKKGDQT